MPSIGGKYPFKSVVWDDSGFARKQYQIRCGNQTDTYLGYALPGKRSYYLKFILDLSGGHGRIVEPSSTMDYAGYRKRFLDNVSKGYRQLKATSARFQEIPLVVALVCREGLANGYAHGLDGFPSDFVQSAFGDLQLIVPIGRKVDSPVENRYSNRSCIFGPRHNKGLWAIAGLQWGGRKPGMKVIANPFHPGAYETALTIFTQPGDEHYRCDKRGYGKWVSPTETLK